MRFLVAFFAHPQLHLEPPPLLGYTAVENRRQGRFWQMLFGTGLAALVRWCLQPLVALSRGVSPRPSAPAPAWASSWSRA